MLRSPPLPEATTRPGTLPLSPPISVMLFCLSKSAVTAVTARLAFCSVVLVRSAETTISPSCPLSAEASGCPP